MIGGANRPWNRRWFSDFLVMLVGYIAAIGDHNKMLNMLVGDTQRIWVYADQGFATPQPVVPKVLGAYARLVAAGYTLRIVESFT